MFNLAGLALAKVEIYFFWNLEIKISKNDKTKSYTPKEGKICCLKWH